MSGINFYPSRNQQKYQLVNELTSNTIAITSSDVDKLYRCNNSTPATISLSQADNDMIAIGSKIEFVRINNTVSFADPGKTITFYSTAGSTAQLRAANSACTFIKINSNSWAIIGDITT